MAYDSDAEAVNLPLRDFLFTLDQIASMLEIKPERLTQTFVYFMGRSVGYKSPHKLMARNIAPPDQPAEWRVANREVVRWLKVKGFRVVERRFVQN